MCRKDSTSGHKLQEQTDTSKNVDFCFRTKIKLDNLFSMKIDLRSQKNFPNTTKLTTTTFWLSRNYDSITLQNRILNNFSARAENILLLTRTTFK